jgi:uncharacterized membrane protein YhaH (DUF805 family)
MTLAGVFWYLCGLSLVALAAASAISVAPGGETPMRVERSLLAVGAVLFAATAFLLRRSHASGPEWLLRTLQALAVAATLLVVLMVVG